jgi:histidine triad (HIT) family protein
MTDCIFCKIASGEIPSQKVYADEEITAFNDIRPAAPVHLLIIPNKHIPMIGQMQESDEALVGRMFSVARQLGEQAGLAESGYRLIINNGPDGGQEVYHLHLHLLGGKRMRHPMG